jgi:4a-hydroxytetrahydrobiopterin dehydratase
MRNITAYKTFESLNPDLPSGWLKSGNLILREFKFKDFLTAMGFINGCGEIANKLDHHPRMTIDYDKVLIETYTHDKGEVTHKDLELADRINLLYNY